MKSETWRANRDYLCCVSDFRRKHGAMLLGGKFVSAGEPERGEVDAAEPIPANTLRLYKYRQ